MKQIDTSTMRDKLAPRKGQPARLSAIPAPGTLRVAVRNGYGEWRPVPARTYRLSVAHGRAALVFSEVPPGVGMVAEYSAGAT